MKNCLTKLTAAARLDCLLLVQEACGSSPKLTDLINKQRWLATRVSDALKSVKGRVRRVFPSQFLDKTIEDIEKLAKAGDKAAQTAHKLLNDGRFKK